MRSLLGLAVVLAACTPDIATGTYRCGEEELCPNELQCDEISATCVYPRNARSFECPAGTNDAEPDDDLASALDVGVAGCGGLSVSDDGCIDAATDVDYLAITTPAGCEAGLGVRLRFPVAFEALTVDVLDAAGNLVAVGAPCGGLDASAQLTVCADVPATGDTGYVLRIGVAEGAPDCDGGCAFNRYQVSIL